MSYTHLTQEERYQIMEWLGDGYSLTFIAQQLKRHKSTISREIKRNRSERGYRPYLAHEKALSRRALNRNAREIRPEIWIKVEELLRLDWSPEQVAGRLKEISHERIYLHIYQDKLQGGELYRHLRVLRKRRKRYSSNPRRVGPIKNRRTLLERPSEVNKRTRIGDWEGDTVRGMRDPYGVLTLVERKSQYVIVKKVENSLACTTRKEVVAAFRGKEKLVSSITFDNGHEFAEHEQMEESLKAKIYFADPYCAWQRGLNEQVNGLLRQYFPKGKSLADVSEEELNRAMNLLNHRPRKKLGYRTPFEVLNKSAKRRGVALRT